MDKAFYEIFNLLYRLGISANYTGFYQTAYAVEMCQREPERLLLVTKMVYPEIAKLCRTSSSAVEGNIRMACRVAWKNNRPLLERLACKPLSQKPHNTLFLAILLYSLPIYQSIPGKAEAMDRFFPTSGREKSPGNKAKTTKGRRTQNG